MFNAAAVVFCLKTEIILSTVEKIEFKITKLKHFVVNMHCLKIEVKPYSFSIVFSVPESALKGDMQQKSEKFTALESMIQEWIPVYVRTFPNLKGIKI